MGAPGDEEEPLAPLIDHVAAEELPAPAAGFEEDEKTAGEGGERVMKEEEGAKEQRTAPGEAGEAGVPGKTGKEGATIESVAALPVDAAQSSSTVGGTDEPVGELVLPDHYNKVGKATEIEAVHGEQHKSAAAVEGLGAAQEGSPSEVSGETAAPAPTAPESDDIEEEAHLAPPPKMEKEATAVHIEEASAKIVDEIIDADDALGAAEAPPNRHAAESTAGLRYAKAVPPGIDAMDEIAEVAEGEGHPGAEGSPGSRQPSNVASPSREPNGHRVAGIPSEAKAKADAESSVAAQAREMAEAAKSAALTAAVAEAQAELDELRAAVPRRENDPCLIVAEKRRRRDALKGQTSKLQVQLNSLASECHALERKLERLVEREARMMPTRHSTGPDVDVTEEEVRRIKEEIKRLKAENAGLEVQAPAHDETRFHIEKLQNERRHAQRKLRSVRAEVKALVDEAARSTTELSELAARSAPSESARKVEAKMGALKAAIASENASRMIAEREIARKLRRVLRVRAALGGFLAQHGVGYADVNASEHASALAQYVMDADARLREREEQTNFLETKVATLKEQYAEAAAELTKLVAARGRAQRRHRSPTASHTTADLVDPEISSLATPGETKSSPAVTQLRQRQVAAARGSTRRNKPDVRVALSKQLSDALASEEQAASLLQAFETADTESTGLADRPSFLRALISFGFEASKREIDATFESVDPAGTGKIEYRELPRLIRETVAAPKRPPQLPPKPVLQPKTVRTLPLTSRSRPAVTKTGASSPETAPVEGVATRADKQAEGKSAARVGTRSASHKGAPPRSSLVPKASKLGANGMCEPGPHGKLSTTPAVSPVKPLAEGVKAGYALAAAKGTNAAGVERNASNSHVEASDASEKTLIESDRTDPEATTVSPPEPENREDVPNVATVLEGGENAMDGSHSKENSPATCPEEDKVRLGSPTALPVASTHDEFVTDESGGAATSPEGTSTHRDAPNGAHTAYREKSAGTFEVKAREAKLIEVGTNGLNMLKGKAAATGDNFNLSPGGEDPLLVAKQSVEDAPYAGANIPTGMDSHDVVVAGEVATQSEAQERDFGSEEVPKRENVVEGPTVAQAISDAPGAVAGSDLEDFDDEIELPS